MTTLVEAAQRIAQPQVQPDKTEYDHGSLRIRANTLVIGNSIYPIANISRVTLSDLRRPIPVIVWIMLGVGIIGMLMRGSMALIGFLMVAAAGYLIFLNLKSRAAADYALSVQMNSGNTAVIMNNDGDFLTAIALELYEVIELEKASNTTFNIDQKVMIDNITGSPVRITGIHGDIVNNVARI
jgi:hypothetical protein